MAASESASVNHVNQLNVQNVARGVASENAVTDALSSADVNLVNQLNAQENVNTARSLNTDTSAAKYANAENVRWLNVQPRVNVDSVDTSRNTTNMDAESDADANLATLCHVQNAVHGERL